MICGKAWIVARDRKNNRILMGGLGVLGCGESWLNDDGTRSNDPDYADAPEQVSSDPYAMNELLRKQIRALCPNI